MAAANPLATSPPETMRNVELRIDIGKRDTMFDRIGPLDRGQTPTARSSRLSHPCVATDLVDRPCPGQALGQESLQLSALLLGQHR